MGGLQLQRNLSVMVIHKLLQETGRMAPSQLLCAALGLPLLGPQGLSQGAGAPGLKILKSLPWLLSVCPVTHSSTPAAQPLQLNPCSFPTGHPGNSWQGSPMGKGLTPRLVLCLGGINQPKRQRFSFREKLTFH